MHSISIPAYSTPTLSLSTATCHFPSSPTTTHTSSSSLSSSAAAPTCDRIIALWNGQHGITVEHFLSTLIRSQTHTLAARRHPPSSTSGIAASASATASNHTHLIGVVCAVCACVRPSCTRRRRSAAERRVAPHSEQQQSNRGRRSRRSCSSPPPPQSTAHLRHHFT